ncbi:MAG: uridine kinase [Saprospiraceae bacterium]
MNRLEESRKLLQRACTPWGIKASLTDKDNYGAIFTRDAVMAGIVGLLLEDKLIIEGFKNTLFHLKALQGKEGQIASNYKVKDSEIATVSFGTLSPKIDSCTWYLVGLGLLLRKNLLEKEDYRESIVQVITLLNAWEYNGKHLLYVPKGGNWADEYVYEGYILYDQLLRVWALSLLASVYEKAEWSTKANAILACLKTKYRDDKSKHFHASIYPGGSFKKFDLAAHALAGIIFEKDNSLIEDSLDWIFNQFISVEKLPPAFYPVIKEGDADWETLSGYHLFDFKNKPHHYHNGGIWWIWIGWLSVSLSLFNKKYEISKLAEIAAQYLDSVPDFNFEEYVSADDLIPNGTPQLCYTAAGIILLSLAKDSFDFSILKATPSSLIHEPIELKKEYFSVSTSIIENLAKKMMLQKDKLVIGICGESGSGKSVTAKCLQIELDKLNINSVILHQDSYFKLPPKDNHEKRKSDISWVGSNEVQMDLLQSHIDQFKLEEESIVVPVVDYKNNTFLAYDTSLKGRSVLIVEGVYAFLLDRLDYKIFMERTYKETLEKRKERTREIYDPFVEQVLDIEHALVVPLGKRANTSITSSYAVINHPTNGEGHIIG